MVGKWKWWQCMGCAVLLAANQFCSLLARRHFAGIVNVNCGCGHEVLANSHKKLHFSFLI